MVSEWKRRVQMGSDLHWEKKVTKKDGPCCLRLIFKKEVSVLEDDVLSLIVLYFSAYMSFLKIFLKETTKTLNSKLRPPR